ncbi:hypothetical protein ACHAWF_010167 [Thalassiosira exigua]
MHRPNVTVQPPMALKLHARGSEAFPSPEFVLDLITTQADGTVLGRSGSTDVLSTVVLDGSAPSPSLMAEGKEGDAQSSEGAAARRFLLDAVRRADAESGAAFVPLQVDYRERFHAAGKIPGGVRRRDNSGPLSNSEVLAARAIDRTVRPWLLMGMASRSESSSGVFPENIVVKCQVQSYDPRPFASDLEDGASSPDQRTHSDPVALAVNSTIAALYQSAHSGSSPSDLPLPEAAACVKLAVMGDGAVVFDPTPTELQESRMELLYAGTRDHALMLEFSANGGLPAGADPGIPKDMVANALRMAREAIIPIIERQEALRDEHILQLERKKLEKDEGLMTDEEVSRLLGFGSSTMELGDSLSSEDSFNAEDGRKIIDEASEFVWSRVEGAALKVFGYDPEGGSDDADREEMSLIHDGGLLSKKVRGRREYVLRAEIGRLLDEEFAPDGAHLKNLYRLAVPEDGSGSEYLAALSDHVNEATMKRAMAECSKKRFRADGRLGLNVVRPISATAPVFPDSGAPREGMPIIEPYAGIADKGAGTDVAKGDDENVPVGSLRFLRNQAEMDSDMNTRRVVAGREMTGDSGILSEVKRAFLHYDFPDFSTGVVKSRVGASTNRRAIGHGNLAEKAILPALPHVSDFPYTIRLTSEVTSSNGSSSMASACGASLALLDAGVPLVAPVAGVSVGLAPGSEELLLDITGTEDHYGDMDFKICGTRGGITAMQLDVKRPLPVETVLAALDLAKEGRIAILGAMEKECGDTLPGLNPRAFMKSTAPRIEVIRFDPNRKRDLVGPGGAVLRQLEDRFDVSLDLSQEGRCLIFGPLASVSEAKHVIMDLVSEVEEGGIYEGTVVEIKDFGAVIELLRNKEGLLHVSEIEDSPERHPGGNVGLVDSHLKVGDKIEVLCTKIDHVQGSIKLSRKKLLEMRRGSRLPFAASSQGTLPINGEILSEPTPDSLEEISWLADDFLGLASNHSPCVVEGGVGMKTSDHVIDTAKNDGTFDEEGSDQLILSDIDDDDDDDDGDVLDVINGGLDMKSSEHVIDTVENDHSFVSEGQFIGNDIGDNDDGDGDSFPYNDVDDFNVELLEENIPRNKDVNDVGHDNDNAHSTSSDSDVSGIKEAHDDELSPSRTGRGAKYNDARWLERFDELEQFKSEHGHCNVPRTSKENPKLARWVKQQRYQFKLGRILEDRLKRLNDIGFEWSPRSS